MALVRYICPGGVLLCLTSAHCFWKQGVVMLGSHSASTGGCGHPDREALSTGPSPGQSPRPQVQAEPWKRSPAVKESPRQTPKSPRPGATSQISNLNKTYFLTDHKGKPAFRGGAGFSSACLLSFLAVFDSSWISNANARCGQFEKTLVQDTTRAQ